MNNLTQLIEAVKNNDIFIENLSQEERVALGINWPPESDSFMAEEIIKLAKNIVGMKE
jgi:hypothetical protein